MYHPEQLASSLLGGLDLVCNGTEKTLSPTTLCLPWSVQVSYGLAGTASTVVLHFPLAQMPVLLC
jgi:hypothetical protein